MITVKRVLVELSKKTLASYAKKAAGSSRAQATLGNEFENDANGHLSKGDRKRFEANRQLEKEFKAGSNKRMKGVHKAIDKLTKEEFVVEDSSSNQITNNPSHGFSGEAAEASRLTGASYAHRTTYAHRAYTKMHSKVRKHTGATHDEAKHFLDSVHGRHLYPHREDTDYLKSSYKKFKKTYNLHDFKEEVDQIDENRYTFTKSSRNHLVRHYPHFHEFARGAVGQNSGGDIGETPIRHGMLAHVRLADHLLHHASKHSATKRGLNIFNAGANADSGIDHDGPHAHPGEHGRPTPPHALTTLEKMFY